MKRINSAIPRLISIMILYNATNVIHCNVDLGALNINDIEHQLPTQPEATNKTIETLKTLIRNKCINVSQEENGRAAFQEIEAGTMRLFECVTNIVNFTSIQAEIDEAAPDGELDVVFHNYCLKRPEALDCYETFNAKMVPCLDAEEREHQAVFLRIFQSLLSFVCHKGGDQIALFIAEKGPECLKSKSDDIQQCINSTFGSYFPKNGLEDVDTLPKFILNQKLCVDLEVLQQCIVRRLEQCSEITPANIVESMFRFIKNETICRTTSGVSAKQSANSGSHNGFTAAGLGPLLLVHLTILSLLAIYTRKSCSW